MLAQANGPLLPDHDYQGYQNDASDYFRFLTVRPGQPFNGLDKYQRIGHSIILYAQDDSWWAKTATWATRLTTLNHR